MARGIAGTGPTAYKPPQNLAVSVRQCTVCRHPMIETINRHIILRTIPREHLGPKYDLGRCAIYRHAKNHVPDDLRKAVIAEKIAEQKAKQAQETDETITGWRIDTRDAVFNLAGRVDKVLKKIEGRDEAAFDAREFVAVAAELRRLVEATAKLQGDLNPKNQIVVLSDSPAWLRVRDHLYAWIASQPPDVRASFVAHMRKIEGGADARAIAAPVA
jgi:hypothetical protein